MNCLYVFVIFCAVLDLAVCQFGFNVPQYNRHVFVNPGPGKTVKDENPIKFPAEPDVSDRFYPEEPVRSQGSDGTLLAKQQFDPITEFSLNLFKKSSASSYGNTAICPISLNTLLAILMQGAEGNTLKQFEDTLFFNKNEALRTYSDFYSTKRSNSRNEFSMANAVMVKHGTEILPQFKSLASRNFKALFDTIDYRNLPLATSKLNNWISQETRGKINDLFKEESLRDMPQVLLLNAVFFKGVWKTIFNPRKTSIQSFDTLPGQEYDVPFMYQTGMFPAGLDQRMGAKWVELPFEGEDMSMIFVLPVKQHELNELVDKLSLDDLKTMINTRNMLSVNMAIPKFNISADTNITPFLYEMGLTDMFSGNSKLTGITGGQPLLVQKAIQKVVMSVDEQGAKAAAGTVLTVNTLSLASVNDVFYFTANQPFLAILVDKINLVPLFMAKINKP